MPDFAKTKRISIKRRERMGKALELRKRGKGYRAIGEALGISHMQAYYDVRDALQEITRETAVEMVNLELERLDELQESISERAVTTGDPRASDSVLRIMERRAKYLGLDNSRPDNTGEEVRSKIDQMLDAALKGNNE